MEDATQPSLADLPNDVLLKILSGVTSREVVCIGHLSRTWPDLSFISSLNLDFSRFPSRQGEDEDSKLCRFAAFVDQILIRRPNSPLQKFFLKFDFEEAFWDHIDSWIRHAVDQKVNVIVLEFTGGAIYDFYFIVLMDSSVKSIRLHRCVLVLPGYMPVSSYKSIKSIHLEGVELTDETIRNITAGCRSLLLLALVSCSRMENVVIRSESLRKLLLWGYVGVPNRMSTLEVSCPYLNLLSIQGFFVHEFVLQRSGCLLVAEVGFKKTLVNFGYWRMIIKKLGHVERLFLQNWGNQTGFLFHQVQAATFQGLIHLRLLTKYTISDVHGIAWLLTNMPSIETLFLIRDLSEDSDDLMPVRFGDYMRIRFDIPKLRVLYMDRFRREPDDFRFLRLMVQGGVQRIVLYPCRTISRARSSRVVIVRDGERYTVVEGYFPFLPLICPVKGDLLVGL